MRYLYLTIVYLFIYIYSTIFSVAPAIAQELKQPNPGLKDFMISNEHGSVKDSYFSGKDDSIIVHIQDLHCNYDAQVSIYHIIDELIEKYGLNLVTVEGSVGRLETAPFSSYPDKDIKEEVAKYFLKTGELDGAAFAHIMRSSGFKFWGVDDENMYTENIKAYKASIDTRDNNARYYNSIKSILREFKKKLYSPELRTLDTKIEAYKNDKLEFSKYVSFLKEYMNKYRLDSSAYPNIIRLVEVFKRESDINFEQVDSQRSEYIERLSKKLNKEALKELLDKSLYFKTAKIEALEFYTYLKELAKVENINLTKDFSQLARYIEYLILYSSIENASLFKEIATAEKALKEKLFANDIQRKLDTLSYNLDILNDLFNLKLTTETLQYYRDHRKEFSTSYFINFISENAARHNIKYKLDPSFRGIDSTLPSLEKFYQLAQERDGILVDNTITKMKEERANIAVLVSGGFHTSGLTTLLKEKGLSYVVVTPKVNSLTEDNTYTSVLLGERNEFDKFYDTITANKK